ncbi:kinase-like domain-containing protein [Baffinella frigidus]|nr:kinase-like domain-containing protein [Cryptophyta sp. CCMP2293]
MSITEFSTSSRDAYVNGVAEALDVASSRVAIASVTEQFTRRRLPGRGLLASNLLVGTTATVPKDKASFVATAATAENLNTALASSGISVGSVSARTVAALTTTGGTNDPASSGDTTAPGGPASDATAAETGPSTGLIAGVAGAAGVLALLVGVWVWWQVCRRMSLPGERVATAEEDNWLVLPGEGTGGRDAKAFLPGAAAVLGGCVLSGTFLGVMGGRAIEGLLTAGEAAPFVGGVCQLLHRLKKYVDDFHGTEEECRRLSVWCLGMMGSFSRLAKESTQVDDGMKSLLQAAATSVKELYELVVARRDSNEGGAGRASSFWTTGAYLANTKVVKDKIQKALDALMLRVAVETRLDVQRVLQRTDRLPAMDEKLDIVLQGLGVIDVKIDRVLKLAERRIKKDARQDRRSDNLENYSIAREKLKLEVEPFASGGSCKVYAGRYHNKQVAAKVINLSKWSVKQMQVGLQSFKSEVDLLCRLAHPYVIRMYGACTDDATLLIIVMELAEGGTLCALIKGLRGTLTDLERMRFVRQLAAGMSYLHSREVAHRDLKSLNILMLKGCCMISDFGLSKENDGATSSAGNTTTTGGTLGTPAWSPPEVLMGETSSMGAAFMADAYSLGVIIWEMFSGELPWAGMLPMQIAIIVTQERRRLEIPPGSPPEIKTLLAACFQHDPTLRPTMAKIEADFPEEDDDIEPTDGTDRAAAAAAAAAAFKHEAPAYTLSSQLTISLPSTQGVRTPQVIDIAVTPGAAPPTLFDASATTNLFPPGAPSISSAGPPER